MTFVEYLTLIALFAGPIAAVLISLWAEDRNTNRAAKERLFITLMAHRKSNPPALDWVDALNLISVVYADRPKVLEQWRALYGVLNTPPWNQQNFTHAYLEMLTGMAKVLGYRSLAQTDIDKFYLPEAHGKQAQQIQDIRDELLGVLKGDKPIHIKDE